MNHETKYRTWQYNAIIGVIAALLFIPFLGEVHLFDWDEINFAESAREMIASSDYLNVQINYIPFWEKPPLFIWMQALSMNIFGINEFAARLPNAICGITTLLVLFNIGRKLKDIRFGILWTLLYCGSILPFFYFKSGIIDPWFNLFIFLGIYQLYLYFSHSERKSVHSAASAFFIGLAVLSKGPVAILVTTITFGVFLLVKKFKVQIRWSDILLFITVLILTGGFWFVLQIIEGNLGIISDFITYQIRLFKTKDAGHGGFLFYHFVILFIGVFPASVFALPSLIPSKRTLNNTTGFYSWMLILFWVVLILFTLVKTKIVHYSSLCYFPLTFLAAYTIYYEEELSSAWKKIIIIFTVVLGSLIAIIFIGITFIDAVKSDIIQRGWVKDPFAVANLDASGGWQGYEMLAGFFLIAGIVLFVISIQKYSLSNAVKKLICIMPVFMFLSMLLVVPRVEAYSQRAAVEFFKSVSSEDVYLETIGYKSYAHLFYGRIKEHKHPMAHNKDWLLKGDIDKTVYFSVKINRKAKFVEDNPDLVFLYERNGFAFYKRAPGNGYK